MALRSCLGLGPPPFYRLCQIGRDCPPSPTASSNPTQVCTFRVPPARVSGEGDQDLQIGWICSPLCDSAEPSHREP